MATKHGENLIKMTRMGAFSAYLVREEDGFTLVDTGLPGSANSFLKTADDEGLPINRVTLTHAHDDHTGSLDQIAGLVPDAEYLWTARTAQFLSGDVSMMENEAQAELKVTSSVRSTKATQIIQAGDKVGSLEVIASPGHTPDHIAFFDTRDGTLIAGDAFVTVGKPAVTGIFRWYFPFPTMATWHVPTGIESAEKLLALKPSRLAVGHGKVVENPADVMQAAIEEAKRKM
ncbi:MAG: MBL fold metallo-hydrolase [Chloroflexi bacterium]|nr:MAG: MBL fold metallo-hydrolase [Chloroflexota bacterium]MBL1195737.1 MBL fold metallo-hydrolase [Chloroflexota bacterium]NOH13026.1 MBL fold metallo-hydrolase [Chloroflexota bacterium]